MTQPIVFANNATSTLASGLSNSGTSLQLQAGTGVLFPQPAAGQHFVGTLTDHATGLVREIVWVTNVTGDVLTIVRAQEGTTAAAWLAGDSFDNLWTAGQATSMSQSTRQQLLANTTLFVATSGSDANSGLSSGSPFATLTHAWNVLQQSYDLNGFVATISIGAGTYSSGLTAIGLILGQQNASSVVIQPTSGSVIISTTSANAVLSDGAKLTITGNITLTVATSGSCLGVSNHGLVQFGGLTFGACAQFHIATNFGGVAKAIGNCTISGSAQIFANAGTTGDIVLDGQTFTFSGTPAFAQSVVLAADVGHINASGSTMTGAATGQRYNVGTNGVINTNGAGANFFPGSVPGPTSPTPTGGVYV